MDNFRAAAGKDPAEYGRTDIDRTVHRGAYSSDQDVSAERGESAVAAILASLVARTLLIASSHRIPCQGTSVRKTLPQMPRSCQVSERS